MEKELENVKEEDIKPKKKKKAPSKKIKVKKVAVVSNKTGNVIVEFLKGIITPVGIVESGFMVNPYFYNPNQKGRYNIILSYNRDVVGENDFIEWIDEVGTKADVPAKMWIGREERYFIKFQTIEKFPVYEYVSDTEEPKLIEITEELGKKSFAQVKFDIFKYHDRMKGVWRFSFKPSMVCIYPDSEKDFYHVNYKGGRD